MTRQWTVTMAAMLMVAGLGAGAAQAKTSCARACADDVRACVVAVKATHACGRLRAEEAKTCRAARKAARHACHGLRRQCAAGEKVCSGQ